MRSAEKSNILSSDPGLVMVESGIRTCKILRVLELPKRLKNVGVEQQFGRWMEGFRVS